MSTALSIIGLAALFALFGLLRPRRGCGSSCGACDGGTCPFTESGDEHA